MAQAWISLESLRRVMVLLTIAGLALSTLGASRYRASCCKTAEPVVKQCCEKHKSNEKHEPMHKQCTHGCDALCCQVAALPASASDRIEFASASVGVLEAVTAVHVASAGDVILPPPRA